MKKEKIDIYLPSRIESVEAAAAKAAEIARDAGFEDESLFGIDMAIREAVANAIKHGNKLDETKIVEISFEASNEGFEVVVRDYGEGFAVDDVPDPTDPDNLMRPDGRGILFMRSFMDKVEWFNHNEGGMLVKMLKAR